MTAREIKIQDLRDRVVLLRRRIVEAEDGSFTEFWTQGDAVWAKVVPYAGREVYSEGWNALGEMHPKYKVTMRYRQGSFDRLKWEGIILSLLCLPFRDARRKWMSCLMYVQNEENEGRG